MSTPPLEVSKERGGRLRLVAVGGLFLVALCAFGGYRFVTRNDEETDDASVDAAIVSLSARVAGVVATVPVSENARVKAGDVLVTLDDAELNARLRQAEAALAAAQAQAEAAEAQARVAEAAAHGGLTTAEAQVGTARAQVGSADAQVEAAKAQLARAEAEASRAAADWDRIRTLLAQGGVTGQAADTAEAGHTAADAALAAARAQLDAAEQTRAAALSRVAEAGGALDVNTPVDDRIAAARASAALARANLDAATAACELARLAHEWGTIVAPIDGTVTHVAARPGQMVSPGLILASIVPDRSFIVANFKETQVGGMRPGDEVEIDLDAFPGRSLHGKVESIAPGTGSKFSLLAPDNASGNFVKVVQRVPVRIEWAGLPEDVVPRAGQSAVVTVHTGG